MLSYRPRIESSVSFIGQRINAPSYNGYQSIMTRQSLRVLLKYIPQKKIILPRFVPAGVYEPVKETGKEIIYYDVPNNLQIDAEFIKNLNLNPDETIFYYIHQFGLHIESNIQLMKEMQQKGYFVIDDRSLTLPVHTYIEFADATAYSFYKHVGIPCGGQVRTLIHHLTEYAEMSDSSSALMKKMRYNFLFYANPIVSVMPPLMFRVYNKLFSKYVNFSRLSGKAFSDDLALLPSTIHNKIEHIDFDSITRRRVEISEIFYSRLNPSVLLPIPIEEFLKQSILGFPILVDDPLQMHKLLLRMGVFTTRFTKIWWWDTTQDSCDLYKKNVVLPAHHRLTDSDVHYIIDRVNQITNYT